MPMTRQELNALKGFADSWWWTHSKNNKSVPADFNEDRPWSVVFRLVAQDETHWNDQVRHPATAWLASGSKGAPMASSEALALAHFPGLAEGHEAEGSSGDKDERRGQANRDKRAARSS